jgi:hypothetical protein
MLFFTLKTIFVSLLLIALIHYLYDFFKNTLTVPKVKDLVNKPAQRYNQMFASLNNERDQTQQKNIRQERNVNGVEERNVNGLEERNVVVGNQSMGPQSMGPQSMGHQSMGPQSMHAELNNFLNELKKPTNANAMRSTIDANHNNFSTANESSFGSYTPF